MRKSTRCCLFWLALSPCALSDCAMCRGWRTSRQLSQGYCFSFSLFHLLQHFPVHPFVRPLRWPSRKPIPTVSCLLSVSLPCVKNRTVLQAKLKQLTYFFPKRRRNDRSENNLLVIKTNSDLGYGGGRCRTLLESIDVREKSLKSSDFWNQRLYVQSPPDSTFTELCEMKPKFICAELDISLGHGFSAIGAFRFWSKVHCGFFFSEIKKRPANFSEVIYNRHVY